MSLELLGNTGVDGSTDLGPKWYSSFPSYGKKLSFQWGELRTDLQTLAPLVRSLLLERETEQPLQDAAMSGLDFGEYGFHNRQRIRWEKNTSELLIERNTGTEANPVWVIHAAFGTDDNGNVIVRNISGVLSQISETGTGSRAAFYNVTHFRVNREDGFYLTTDEFGNPVLNGSNLFGVSQTFENASSVEWQVTHNFNTNKLIVQAYDDGDVQLVPTKIDISDPNTTYFYFSTAVAGKAIISTGGTGAAEIIPRIIWKDGVNTIGSGTHNVDGDNFYYSTNADGEPVLNPIQTPVYTDGRNAFTANQSMGSNRLQDVLFGSSTNDAANYGQVLLRNGTNTMQGDIDGDGSFKGINFAAGTADSDTIRKDQAMVRTGEYPMTGNMYLGGFNIEGLANATAEGQAVTYDQAVLADGTNPFTADQSMGGNKLTNLGEPTDENDAVRFADLPPAFYGIVAKLSDDSQIFKTDSIQFSSADFNLATAADGDPRLEIIGTTDNITFKETEDGGYNSTSNLLKVDSDFFYLSAGGDGKPIQSLKSNLSFKGSVTAETSIEAGTDVTAGRDLISTRRLEVGTSARIVGSLTVGNGFYGTGDSTVDGTLTVNDHFYVGSNVNVSGRLDVAGKATFGSTGSLNVQGNILAENGKVRAAGFYLTDDSVQSELITGVTFKETEAGGFSQKNNTVNFDSDFFYLSSNSRSEPVVGFVGFGTTVRKVSETFGSASEWQMSHNLNTSDLVVSVYNNSKQLIFPGRVDVSDVDIAYFYFSEAVAGRAVVVG